MPCWFLNTSLHIQSQSVAAWPGGTRQSLWYPLSASINLKTLYKFESRVFNWKLIIGHIVSQGCGGYPGVLSNSIFSNSRHFLTKTSNCTSRTSETSEHLTKFSSLSLVFAQFLCYFSTIVFPCFELRQLQVGARIELRRSSIRPTCVAGRLIVNPRLPQVDNRDKLEIVPDLVVTMWRAAARVFFWMSLCYNVGPVLYTLLCSE